MNDVLRETDAVRLVKTKRGGRLEVKLPRHYPKRVSVKPSDIPYLTGLTQDADFNAASVWDFGLGVFDRP